MSKPLIILGNGGHASVLTEILISQGEKIIGFTAPITENNQFGLKYLGDDSIIEQYLPSEVELLIGVGMLAPRSTRQKIYNKYKSLGYFFKSIIHPSVINASSVRFGEGVQIMAGVILQTNVVVADNTIVNTGVIIDHDSMISNNVHLAPGCKLSGNVKIGRGCFVGAGSTFIHGVEIGENCIIGAGSVILKSFSSNKKIFGVPAKEIT